MSAISEKVRQALFAKLNVSSVTNLATGGVHYQTAPEGADLPYLLFQEFVRRPVVYAFGNTLVCESDDWLLKALTDEDSSQSVEPQGYAEDILEAALAAIGNTLTIPGGEVWEVKRVSDITPYTEPAADRLIHHHGFQLRVTAK